MNLYNSFEIINTMDGVENRRSQSYIVEKKNYYHERPISSVFERTPDKGDSP